MWVSVIYTQDKLGTIQLCSVNSFHFGKKMYSKYFVVLLLSVAYTANAAYGTCFYFYLKHILEWTYTKKRKIIDLIFAIGL